LDQTLFWNEVNLQNKLDDITIYYNKHRVHSYLNGEVPANFGEERLQSFANIEKFNRKMLCRGLVQLPITA
jgi:transposase InsO family protein